MTTTSPTAIDSLAPRERIAVLIHWMKGLAVAPGNALDGLELAGRAVSHGGHEELAPAWVKAWEGADKPFYGIVAPPKPGAKVAVKNSEEDTPEVKALCALMDPLDVFLRDEGHVTDEESDLMLDCWWALHNEDHEMAAQFLALMDRLLRKALTPKRKAKS